MQLKYIKSLVPSGLKLYSAVHWRSQVRLLGCQGLEFHQYKKNKVGEEILPLE